MARFCFPASEQPQAASGCGTGEIHKVLGEIPILASEQKLLDDVAAAEEPTSPEGGDPGVLADGMYAIIKAVCSSTTTCLLLRVLGGDFFAGTVLASTLTKLVIRFDKTANAKAASKAGGAGTARGVGGIDARQHGAVGAAELPPPTPPPLPVAPLPSVRQQAGAEVQASRAAAAAWTGGHRLAGRGRRVLLQLIICSAFLHANNEDSNDRIIHLCQDAE
ncbi:hypothetical protein C8F04DRAFT_1201557 [Mycena alexandri]|uniref:Uncharacterized protein n=1 Tax=Mycena alexandri TaxID=1745969 RepID=A0AAD6RWS5_9AGAR|nr:hypothetical protein C8F04DRAFT_1201557 [Mycena alexandri]